MSELPDEMLGDEADVENEPEAEADDVEFLYEAGAIPPPVCGRAARLKRFILSATALSWMLSLIAHGAVATTAVIAVGAIAGLHADSAAHVYTPPVAHLAAGDTSEETGIRNHAGELGQAAGLEAPRLDAPTPPQAKPTPAAAAAPADASQEVAPPAPQPPAPPEPVAQASVDPPAMRAPESVTLDPAPISPQKHSELEVATTVAGERTTPAHAPAAVATTQPAQPQKASSPVAAANLGQAAPGKSETSVASGDNIAGGRGGETTGGGGTALSGKPGVHAQIRDGRNQIKPTYPEICKRRGEEGTVKLEIEILEDGKIASISVLSDGGHPLLAEATIRSFDGVVFEPATLDGKPVRDFLTFPYNFKLPSRRR